MSADTTTPKQEPLPLPTHLTPPLSPSAPPTTTTTTPTTTTTATATNTPTTNTPTSRPAHPTQNQIPSVTNSTKASLASPLSNSPCTSIRKNKGGRKAANPHLTDEQRRRERVLKNRESAMKSLQKKKRYTEDLENRAIALARRNAELKEKIRALLAQLNVPLNLNQHQNQQFPQVTNPGLQPIPFAHPQALQHAGIHPLPSRNDVEAQSSEHLQPQPQPRPHPRPHPRSQSLQQQEEMAGEEATQEWPCLSDTFLDDGAPQPLLFESPQVVAPTGGDDDDLGDSFFSTALENEGGGGGGQGGSMELFGEEKISAASFDMANLAVSQ